MLPWEHIDGFYCLVFFFLLEEHDALCKSMLVYNVTV